MIASLLGGLGVFLLGMVLLTDGLKAIAGNALRQILTRYVATPVSGVGWGALVTTLVQSSTATTLTTVGFVSAGLLTFTQAIGVIFGANLGTTSTGWIVSQLGFKMSLGSISPPLILVGVAMRLLFKGRAAHVGTALAGFALLFMGIDLLQGGMGSLAARLSPEDLPGGVSGAGGWGTRLILVGFGFLMTVIMQSSSASMTTTLAAVASGAIGLEHAAALIVGQNIGTTPTAVAAAIGAPTAARRTAAAHVLFNALTGVIALVILPWLLRACVWMGGGMGLDDAPSVLALFHTLFNVLGVVILLPVVGPFARMIERIFPERGPRSTRYLAPSVATVGPVALEAARRSLLQLLGDACDLFLDRMRRGRRRGDPTPNMAEAQKGLHDVVRFVHSLAQSAQEASERHREKSLLHAADHVDRFLELLQRTHASTASTFGSDSDFQSALDRVAALAERIAARADEREESMTESDWLVGPIAGEAALASKEMAELRRSGRAALLRDTASGRVDPDTAMAAIDALVWLDGVTYHLWRSAHHLKHDPTPEDVGSTSTPDDGG